MAISLDAFVARPCRGLKEQEELSPGRDADDAALRGHHLVHDLLVVDAPGLGEAREEHRVADHVEVRLVVVPGGARASAPKLELLRACSHFSLGFRPAKFELFFFRAMRCVVRSRRENSRTENVEVESKRDGSL